MASNPRKANRVLCHPLRTRIIESLTEASASSAQLAERLEGNLHQVSYHVAILAEAGFIRPVATRAEHRTAGRVYELAPAR